MINSELFQYIGLLGLTYAVLSTSLKILKNVGIFWFGWYDRINFREYGQWAVVTGGTDGMGRVFVEELAKRGLNVFVISNEPEKFELQKKQLEDKHPSIEAKFLFTDFKQADYDEIKSQLKNLDVGVLVNNVGICYDRARPFDEFVAVDQHNDVNMININLVSTTKMTSIVLPNMLKKKKKPGIIINMSSVAAEVPSPFVTVYSASKAYVDFFSRALNAEYASRGLIVQSVRPYFVATKLVSISRNFIVPTPDEFVPSLLKTVGILSVTNGCLVHSFMSWLSQCFLMPKLFLDMFVGFSTNWFKKFNQ